MNTSIISEIIIIILIFKRRNMGKALTLLKRADWDN